jgi:2-(1,2-epoxy-1,2-dihydrophenyl)acetyl-CoA isomerase
MTSDSPILVAPHATLPGVITLTLNRPHALNALDMAMTRAFVPAIERVVGDPSARVVIVQGAGEHFMAGGDIKGFGESLSLPGTERKKHFMEMIHFIHAGVELMQRSDVITVAKVRGACAGFGMSLAIGCDLTIASDDAYFATAYKAIGLTPDGGQSFFLPRLVGVKKAMELTLLSERIRADEAQRLGFVNRVVPPAQLDATVDAVAQQLARSARGAMSGAKRLINTSFAHTPCEQLNAEAESFSSCAATDDFAEGIRAFIEKRPPKFGQ